jgi:peptidoglycan/LPS O-acetylase OafA/YrhL
MLFLPEKTDPRVLSDSVLREYMPELDSLRGIAVLLVLFYHGFAQRYDLHRLSGLPRIVFLASMPGWVGVDLFFVLSGFLITGILLDTRDRVDYYRHFYIRRALRILPIYYAVLALVTALSGSYLVGGHTAWPSLLFNLFYCSNLSILFGIPFQYPVLWSLAVEEHFYLLWPVIIRRFTRRSVVYSLLFVGIACPILRSLDFWLGYSLGPTDFGQGYTWLVADGIAMGALLAILARGRFQSRMGMRSLAIISLTISLTLFVGGAHSGILQQTRLLGTTLRQTALNFLFAGTISLALVLGSGHWRSLVRWPLLEFVGTISYGLYLFHMVIFALVDYCWHRVFRTTASEATDFLSMMLRFVAGIGLTVLIAYLSRWYFEERFLQLKNRFDFGPRIVRGREDLSSAASCSRGLKTA